MHSTLSNYQTMYFKTNSMKNNILIKIWAFAMSIVFFALISCEKDDMKTLATQLESWNAEEITSTSVELSGFVVAQGSGITEQGVCWSIGTEPTIDDANKVADDIDGSVYWVTVSGLEHFTAYNYRAYALDANGSPLYGEVKEFKTLAHLSTVTIADAPSVITDVTATIPCDVPYDGKADVTAKGVCYSTESNPTLDNEVLVSGEGMGEYNAELTGLKANTTYYVKAYSTNSVGTSFSKEITFSTPIGVATVNTVSAQAQATSATVEGEITYDGGAAVTERGVVYGTEENPTIEDTKVVYDGSESEFSVDLDGLEISTTYHARAYAINSEGVAYGEDLTFSTYPTALYMVGDGVSDWSWNIEIKMQAVHSHPELFWRIVWMNETGGFKMNSDRAWDGGEFGKTGDAVDGVYEKGGDNVPVPGTAGYYMVVVDLSKNTVEVTDVKLYGIGNAFGGAWAANDPNYLFTIDNANEVIRFNGVPDNGDLRMHVAASTLNCDWWQAEVNIDPATNEIVYREGGGDPAAFPLISGDDIVMNFKTGLATIE